MLRAKTPKDYEQPIPPVQPYEHSGLNKLISRATKSDVKLSSVIKGVENRFIKLTPTEHFEALGLDAICNTYFAYLHAPIISSNIKKAWQDSNHYATKVASAYSKVWVASGPIYDEHIVYLSGKNNSKIAIPTGFFRLLLIEEPSNKYKVLSFIFDTNSTLPYNMAEDCTYSDQYLKTTLTDLNNIMQRTGMKISIAMPSKNINVTESEQLWPLGKESRMECDTK